MHRSIVGARIRQRRSELGLSQAELANRIGISPSYMNLIELNKRRIAGTLLRKTAQALALPLEELDGVAEKRLFETLTGLAHHPSLRETKVESDRTDELIGRFPGWARGLGELAQSERSANVRVQFLSDRLSNDPYLSETLHRMLTRIAAVRSTTEILTAYTDIPTERRDRFDQIVHEEILKLSDVGEALATYLDRTDHSDPVLTPVDEVRALFDGRHNHFDEIEQAAAPLTKLLDVSHPGARLNKARSLAREYLTEMLDALIEQETSIETSAAAGRAHQALLNYAACAIAMPMDVFAEQAADARYDIELLAEFFTVEFETICQRLAALPRGQSAPQFGYLSANAAGSITEIFGLEGLTVPRYASACPLWALFRAQQSPETAIRQRVLFPSGQRFVFVARARRVGAGGFGTPRHFITDMAAMKEEDAVQTVYRPEVSAIVEDVGPGCRLCPRSSCAHRVEDPLS